VGWCLRRNRRFPPLPHGGKWYSNSRRLGGRRHTLKNMATNKSTERTENLLKLLWEAKNLVRQEQLAGVDFTVMAGDLDRCEHCIAQRLVDLNHHNAQAGADETPAQETPAQDTPAPETAKENPQQ
jgi:hypothetical protein